jgi:aldehyde dehydrogenase (NAD+)
VLRRARHELAALSSEFAAAIPANLSRTPADTLVAELMPLLDACRFLEREAASILRTRALGRRGRPFWLSGIHAEVQYAPFGTVLVIAPGNYPLFLPGVQALQALAAGNSVVWKPGRGGAPVAHLFADALFRSGLSRELLRVTPETAEAAVEEIRFGVDKVFFTGSATTGRKLLRLLADTLTPCVAELSGSDACVVLPSADLGRVVAALTFGMRLNGSETCMAPRRVLLVDATPARRELFLIQLRESLAHLPPVPLAPATRAHLDELLADAQASGATVLRETVSERTRPILVLDTRPEMAITQADLFAPLLSVLDVQGETGVLAAQRACPYALTTSIFGAEREARSLAARLETGVVTINDLIVPTADPRLPFGGRRQSGFGVTRGREGLLEMVAPRVVTVRRGRSTRHLEPVGARQQPFFAGILAATHAGSWRSRWAGLRQAFAAARNLSAQTTAPDRK